jgi:hypothetical protein
MRKTLFGMFVLLGFSLLLSILAPGLIVAQNLLRWPESIVFDSLYNRYLVSNYLTGDIVQIDDEGNQSYFVQAQNAIQGLEIVDNTVYVGCGASVKGFDLATGDSVMDVVIPGVQNLNDVTSDTSGNLYISDVYGHAIYKIRLSDHSYSTFASLGISFPNGILFDEENNRLLLCSFRYHSPIQAISLEDSTVTTITSTGISDCDGLTKDNFGNYYVTSWVTYAIYRYDSSFTNPPVRFYNSAGGPADISYNRRDDILAIPLMSSNGVDFVPIVPTSIPGEEGSVIPRSFVLNQNFPNPFNPSTTIEFEIPDIAGSGIAGDHRTIQHVSLIIYDTRGRQVRTLIDAELVAGRHSVVWNGKDNGGRSIRSGIYFYRLKSGEDTNTRRMTVLK